MELLESTHSTGTLFPSLLVSFVITP